MDIRCEKNTSEAWHIEGNDHADRAAGSARKADDLEFATLCSEVRTHWTESQDIFTQIYQYLLAIA